MEKYTWPLKIVAKIVLSRLPVPYDAWRKLGLFRLGRMDKAAHALKIFRLHVAESFPEGLPPEFTALEMGPGDSIASALVAAAHGAKKIWLADVGPYAARDVGLYKSMAETLRAEGINAPDLTHIKTFEEILAACNAVYLTQGLRSLKTIPGSSVDLIWSHSVFEHIRYRDFNETMHELARILSPRGRMSHSIDLKDHLAQSLNNMRFPHKIWESNFLASSGFYTNRLRASEIMTALEKAGFSCTTFKPGRWPTLPVARTQMAPEFRNLSEDDLYIRTMHIVLENGRALKKAA